MSAWLEDPQAFASGTSMRIDGVKDRIDRADIIAYLKTQSGS